MVPEGSVSAQLFAGTSLNGGEIDANIPPMPLQLILR